MGKEAQNQARKLGMMNLPRYTFYCQPRKMKSKFSRQKPDIAYLIENWIKEIEPQSIINEAGSGGRSSRYYFLAPQSGIYIELIDRMAGTIVYNPNNHVNKLDVFTNNQDYVKALVKGINGIHDDGILPHLNLKKLEKKFKVKGEDIINSWNSFLQ
ncbi:MAG: hypothetical protein ACFFA0_07315 [Promethearchaeota archaeon]